MPKLKQISFEPESNQRSKDSQGVRWSLIGMKCLIWKTPFSLQDRFGFLYTGFFVSGDTKSEENGNVNAKVKTNLLRAEIEPAT